MQVRYQAAPRPDRGGKFNDKAAGRIPAPRRPQLPAQQLEDVIELGTNLPNDLLALGRIGSSLVAHQALPSAADREALFVEQAADLPNDQHVLPLIVAAVAAPFDGLQLREFLLPVAQHVRLDRAEVADFADREVAFAGNRREVVVIPWFQHRLRLALLVFGPGGT